MNAKEHSVWFSDTIKEFPQIELFCKLNATITQIEFLAYWMQQLAGINMEKQKRI